MIMAWHRSNETSRRLDAIAGVGPALATAVVASVPDPKIFRSAHNFAAWIGRSLLRGSWFSTRSANAAATSGPKRRRCNVHNGLTPQSRGPTASVAAACTFAVGQHVTLRVGGRLKDRWASCAARRRPAVARFRVAGRARVLAPPAP